MLLRKNYLPKSFSQNYNNVDPDFFWKIMENPRFSFLQFYPGLMNSVVIKKSGYEHGVKKHRLFKWFINCELRTVVWSVFPVLRVEEEGGDREKLHALLVNFPS